MGCHIIDYLPEGLILYCKLFLLLLQSEFTLAEVFLSFEHNLLMLLELVLSFSKFLPEVHFERFHFGLTLIEIFHEEFVFCYLFLSPYPHFLPAGLHGQVPGIAEQRTIGVGALVQLTTENFWIRPKFRIEVFGGTERFQSGALISFSLFHNLRCWPTGSALTSDNAVDGKIDGKGGSSSVFISGNVT